MEQFVIEGGQPLSGTVVPAGNKNAAQPLLAATLLTEEPVVLKNVPQIGDIGVIVEILRDLGAEVRESGDHELTVCTEGVDKSALRADFCRKVRGSFMFAGPLLRRFGQATSKAAASGIVLQSLQPGVHPFGVAGEDHCLLRRRGLG